MVQLMYLKHFGLNEQPFSIAPNPHYLYFTDQHQEALAHLTYGLGSAGGIILLTGEVGTGKTTISRKLLEDIPEHIELAWIVNPRLSAQELLAAFCDELSITYDSERASIKTFTDLINSYLIEAHGQGRNVVLMIDEAQNLSPDVLEQLRLLTNLETSERKLLQIILLGQPELKEMLERTDLRQLAQRITARFHLQSLSREDSHEYIRHRLAVAGCDRPVFSNKAMNRIFSISQGIPRLMNLLCDRAMLGVYGSNAAMVEVQHVQQASLEVLGEKDEPPRPYLLIPLMLAAVLIVTNAVLLDKIWPWLPTQAGLVQAESVLSKPDPLSKPYPHDDKAIDTVPVLADEVPVSLGRSKESVGLVALDQGSSESAEPAAIEQGSLELESSSLVLAPLGLEQPDSIETASQPSAESTPVEQLVLRGPSKIGGGVLLGQGVALDAAEQDSLKASSTVGEGQDTMLHSSATLTAKTPWQVIKNRGSKQRAFQTLAHLWHGSFPDEDIRSCEQLVGKKIVCLQQRANSWLVREYNRPVMFQIAADDGERHFAVIRSVQQGRVIIQLDQQHWDVSLSELEHHWQGMVTLIWAKPAAYQGDIQPGDGGALIPWLADKMDRIQGEMIPAQSFTVMNDVLLERLKDFQRAEGLPADGIVGLRSLLRMNERMNPDTPVLNSKRSQLF